MGVFPPGCRWWWGVEGGERERWGSGGDGGGKWGGRGGGEGGEVGGVGEVGWGERCPMKHDGWLINGSFGMLNK